jgi:hypothetical protein
MDTERLREWRGTIEAELQAIRDRIQCLNAELQKKTQQAELIRRLIESEDSCIAVPNQAHPHSPDCSAPSHAPTPSMVKDYVYEILKDAKRAMNINEIHAEFNRRGYTIPGKGTPFNILVHIGRELKLGRGARFHRVGRGTYSLTDKARQKTP